MVILVITLERNLKSRILKRCKRAALNYFWREQTFQIIHDIYFWCHIYLRTYFGRWEIAVYHKWQLIAPSPISHSLSRYVWTLPLPWLLPLGWEWVIKSISNLQIFDRIKVGALPHNARVVIVTLTVTPHQDVLQRCSVWLLVKISMQALHWSNFWST